MVPGQGPSCPEAGGWRVFLEDGTSVLTHGPDAAPATDSETAAATDSYPSVPVACTTTANEHHVQVIYVWPTDKVDRSSQMKSPIREMVARANGQLHLEASLFDDEMALRFRCDNNGQVSISVERLSFTHAQADFSRISGELRSRGYNLATAKYLVFYDANNGGGLRDGIAGQASVHMDDRLVPDNANLVGPDFAINYGYTGRAGAEVSLHEMGHNQGAVQLTAPHTSGGWHCNDGQDTMCYPDGGANASYTGTRCTDRTHWDCGHDTYFNPAPPAGTYLATHWNFGSRYNKFLEFGERPNGPPTVTTVTCDKATTLPDTNASCNVWVFDPDDDPAFSATPGKLNVTIDWGDGNATGPLMVDSGRGVSVKHAWAGLGEFTITATVRDNGVPPLTSAPFTLPHKTGCYFRGTGPNLLVGAGGFPLREPISSREHDIPTSACEGAPYTLTGNSPNDFDVCWYEDGALLRCDTGFGNEAGTVPMGATSALVILRFGANGVYNLVLGG